MSEIRPTYTGLITLLTGLVTLVTITISTLIITRTLSQEDYGTWGLIFSLFVYAFMAGSFINFWTIRDIARGKEIGKTSLFSNSLFSITRTLFRLTPFQIINFRKIPWHFSY